MKSIIKMLLLCVLVSIISLSTSVLVVFASNNSSKEINIRSSTDSLVFNITKMVPGDTSKRNLSVQNRSEIDFIYNVRVNFNNGSKKLYEEFLLKVWDSNGVLHEGKLKDFKGFSPRLLKSLNEEELLFQVEFPYELGNEFQGLGFEFELRFTIEDYTSIPPPETPSNPGNPDNHENPVPNPEEPDNPENLDPEDPVVPDSPETNKPENPSDPQEPDEPVLNPPHPIDPDTLNSPLTDGQILPSTSTNFYNFIFGGALLLLAGALILYLSRKRNLDMKV